MKTNDFKMGQHLIHERQVCEVVEVGVEREEGRSWRPRRVKNGLRLKYLTGTYKGQEKVVSSREIRAHDLAKSNDLKKYTERDVVTTRIVNAIGYALPFLRGKDATMHQKVGLGSLPTLTIRAPIEEIERICVLIRGKEFPR